MVFAPARNWWALAIRGAVAVVFGVIALAWPGITLWTLALVYGAYAFVDGVFALAAAIAGTAARRPWGMLLLEGIVGILIGLFAVLWTPAVAVALAYLVAFWAVLTGILEILAAIRLRQHITSEWALVLGGVLSVLLGVLLILWPPLLAVFLGWYAIVWGVLLLTLAFRLRQWSRQLPTLKPY